MSAQWLNPRKLRERIVVTGVLMLETPTHIGNGDDEGLLDMPIHLDNYDGSPLLPGSSLAGALRSYVNQYDEALAKALFGEVTSIDDGSGTNLSRTLESLLIVDDALGYVPETRPRVELRDGVAIDAKTRTADDAKKFDIELLAAGTYFPLSFELCIREGEDQTALLQAFAVALDGLAQGKIALGKRKRRGFGRCRVDRWQVQRFNMRTTQGMLAWLRYDPIDQLKQIKQAPVPKDPQDIFALLQVSSATVHPYICTVNAYFKLDGSLLIRSLPEALDDADMVHLRSWRRGRDGYRQKSVLSGTSLAGALRARALRIANTVGRR
ncbi:MAG TPA: RAMP superfamily CRISPR-associated protein, partial [Caldilineaceae bacterium]|nr:RAMP superfamily CRISPR-associated protein [Caldilineaceae bacterium]